MKQIVKPSPYEIINLKDSAFFIEPGNIVAGLDAANCPVILGDNGNGWSIRPLYSNEWPYVANAPSAQAAMIEFLIGERKLFLFEGFKEFAFWLAEDVK